MKYRPIPGTDLTPSVLCMGGLPLCTEDPEDAFALLETHRELGRLRLTRDEVSRDLEESLDALGVDRVDIFYLHRDDESMPVEPMIDYLNGFVQEDLARSFGCSNWRGERICRQSPVPRSPKDSFTSTGTVSVSRFPGS